MMKTRALVLHKAGDLRLTEAMICGHDLRP